MMRRSPRAICCLAALACCLVLPTAFAASAAANASFAFKLLGQLAKDQPRGNIFISPYGASTVLQMACNGAGGQTKSEIRQVLGTANLHPDEINRANRQLTQSLTAAGTNVVLTIANAAWCRTGPTIKPDFIAANQQSLQATVSPMDFNDPRSVGIMNAWAAEKTHGRINSIADGLIGPLTELFLANAVYFKGKWLEPFDPKATRDRSFNLPGGIQRKVPMMEESRKFFYRRGTRYQAVRLPYQGWSIAMYVFLPDNGSSPEALLAIMNGDTWQRTTRPGFNDQQGTLVLPKLTMSYAVELKQPLHALGMRSAFAKADFSGISDVPLSISAVRQRTFVEVNEEGTEAAAVTAANIKSSGPEISPPKPFRMVVDRPFLFIIEDMQTGTILFMGLIYNPAQP